MAAIDKYEDEVFMDRFDDVEWTDDVAKYQCTRCHKVLVQHYIANCQHKFCSNCKRILDDGSHRWRCPMCQVFIEDMGRQDMEFRDEVFKLRLHCPNRKYGCQHICPFQDLKEHLRGCEHTKESALPVLYTREITAEMVDRMLSNQLSQLRNEMREQMAEVRKECDERDNENNRKLRLEVDQLKQKVTEMSVVINDRVDGIKSDLAVETIRLRNEIKELQKKQPMRSDSSTPECLSLAVEKNKSLILELKGKTEAYNEMMEANYRKNNDLMHELKYEFKAKYFEMEQTINDLKTALEIKMAESKDRMDLCYVDMSQANVKVTECNEKITTIEKTTRDNQLITNTKLQQKLNLETFILSRNPQMDCFTVAENKCYFQPDFTWTISGLEEKLKQTTFAINSVVFPWTGYPVQAQAKMELRRDGGMYMSLCLKEINKGQPYHLNLIPAVYYVIRDRSGSSETKHWTRNTSYLFTSKFNHSLTFERQLTHKSHLTDPLYVVDDCVVVDVYVEPPSMAQLVLSYDGTLVWAIDHYRKRKEMAKKQLVLSLESPYFYTAPNGYRVQIRIKLDGYGEYKSKGLTAEVDFLSGEFDVDLSPTFAHLTTITLFNRKDPQRNITKTVDQTAKYYFVDVCSDEEIENVIEKDIVFFKVTIKPKN